MMIAFCNLFQTVRLGRLLGEDGQDLVEYALIVALLSFCAIAAEQNVAVSISGAFTHIADAFAGTV
jgi:Flp pilus assembly pilin Flp